MRSLVTIAALVLVASVIVPRYAVQMTGRGAAQTGAVAPAAASVAPNPDNPRSALWVIKWKSTSRCCCCLSLLMRV